MYVQIRPLRHRLVPGACTGTTVSSVWIARDRRTRSPINETRGWTSSAVAWSQAHIVLRAIETS